MASFIRALKAPTDPPQADGPLKIEIATQAWTDKNFRIPNKDQLIADWLLTHLLKQRIEVSDTRFWALLADILVSQTPWLTPILNRVPIAPILISLLSTFPDEQLASLVCRSLWVIWPISVQKMGVEQLLECFGAVIHLFVSAQPGESLSRIASIVTSSFRSALSNAPNKKKISSSFHNYLDAWIKCIAQLDDLSHSTTLPEIYAAGIDVLFGIDALRQSEIPIFETLPVVSVLPRLFTSLVYALKKHRNALFPNQSAIESVRECGIRIFSSCCTLLDQSIDDTWPTRLALLETVQFEELFEASLHGAKEIFEKNADLALAALQGNDSAAERPVAALSVLTYIDYDLITPFIPRILPQSLFQPPSSAATLKLLMLLLDFPSKTRTLPTYLSHLFRAISSHIPNSAPKFYPLMSAGPLFSTSHLDALSKSINTFLTSGQLLDTVESTLQELKDRWNAFLECGQTKRKLESPSGDVDHAALTFSLSVRVASSVLQSLPIRNATEDVQAHIQRLLDDGIKFLRSTVITKMVQSIRKNDGEDLWSEQIVTAAALRLSYVLHRNATFETKLAGRLLDIAGAEGTLPELSVEIYRTLLKVHDLKLVLDSILAYLDRCTSSPSTTWTGLACSLCADDSGRKQSYVALLHLLIERWLPLVDECGSEGQLNQLAQLFVDIKLEATSGALCQGRILFQALRSAQFWELPNMRRAFLAVIESITETMENERSITGSVLSVYEKLLFVPFDYLSRTSRTTLMRRALVAEIAYDSQPVLRIFLARLFAHLGSVEHEHVKEFLERILDPSRTPIDAPPQNNSTTLDLIRMHVISMIQSSREAELAHIIASLPLGDLIENVSPGHHNLMQLIDVVTHDFSFDKLSKPLQDTISGLYKSLVATLLSRMESFTPPVNESLNQSKNILSAWRRVLSLRTWLRVEDHAFPQFGPRMVSKILTLDDSSSCRLAFAVVLQELHGSSVTEREKSLDFAVAAYLSLAPKAQEEIDIHMSQTCKQLSVTDYAHILELLGHSLSLKGHTPDAILHMIHLSTLLLHEAPQGTLKPTQAFVTECFSLYINHPTFALGSSPLHLRMLEFVSQHCTDRPAALRPLDLNNIWALLSHSLNGSKSHDTQTSTNTFHHIVTVVSILVRLRRDLVVSMIPHIGMILRQLIMAIRAPRPQLGAKQKRFVTDTLPSWISPSHPLTAEEGKALARLLTTLITKTIPCTYLSTADAPKAESLAKPFSKHSAYVLRAYIDAVNDPLCVISAELRRELQPGLYALCDMINDHSRDAMMVSALDSGGKVTLKSLWKEYEKQKYVGKG